MICFMIVVFDGYFGGDKWFVLGWYLCFFGDGF